MLIYNWGFLLFFNNPTKCQHLIFHFSRHILNDFRYLISNLYKVGSVGKSCNVKNIYKAWSVGTGRILVLMVFILLVYSCNRSKPSELIPGKTDNLALAPEISDEIHALLYEDPLAARNKSMKLLDSIGSMDPGSRIILLKFIGSSYVLETDYPKAIKYYNQALALAEEIQFYREIASINNNLGMIFNEIGNAKTAYTYYFTALDYYDLAKEPEKKIGTLNNIGVMFLNMNHTDKALTYFEKALDPTIEQKDIILEASILNNIAICYSKKDPERAFGYLEKAMQLSEQVNNHYSLCISYQTLGNTFLETKQTEKALDAYSKSIEIAEEANLTHQKFLSKIGFARAMLKMGRINEALNIGFEVKSWAEANSSLVLTSEAHKLLSDIYDANGDYENGLKNFREYIKDRQKLADQTVIGQIYDVEVTHLNQQNKMQSLELEKKELAIRNKNNLLILTILIFALGLAGLYLVYRNHRHKQKNKLQETIIALTKQKSKAALEAEIRERKRIGSELHDRIGYLLSLSGLHVSVLQKRRDLSCEKTRELLTSLTESIDEAFDEVRNISHNLSPSLLSGQGLKGALNSISAKINQSSKLKITFDTFGLDSKMDELLENVLYRAIQEIVNNTIKHSKATELFIQLAQDNNQITLMAEDNGEGFDVNPQWEKSSFGLSHIKSGIKNLNGTLFIDSKKGRGTIISIFIPLD